MRLLPGLLAVLRASINQPKLFRIGSAYAVVTPLANDAIEVCADRINYRAGTVTVPVLAFRFAT